MNSSVSNANRPEVEQLLAMYTTMIKIRRVEERIADHVPAGEFKTPCHLYIGQEAIAAGVCAALKTTDYVWGNHRSHGHYLAKGGDLPSMLAEIFGKKEGCSRGRGGSMHLFAAGVGILGTVPLVGATVPLAVGAGFASKLLGDRAVSVSFFGDGALEEGHVHESMNLAALHRLPVIFVCENNFYASHLQLLERRASDDIPSCGQAHGLYAVSVDGNDVSAVYLATAEAVDRARGAQGPTLLECRTYRWRGHVGPSWDMDVGVKRKDELNGWLAKDPVSRAKATLSQMGVQKLTFETIETSTQSEIDEAIRFAKDSPYPTENDLLECVFHNGGESN